MRGAPGLATSLLPAARSGSLAQPAAAASSNLATVPAPSPTRIQRIATTLDLRVANAQAVSADTKRIVRIAHSLGGYPSAVDVSSSGSSAYASITLRIPKGHLQEAVGRLSALGTIIGEHLTIRDLEAQVNAITREIARLKAELAAWQRQVQTPATQKHIAELSNELVSLQGRRATTIRNANDATISVELTTRPVPPPSTTVPDRSTASASPSAGSGSAPSTSSRSERRS